MNRTATNTLGEKVVLYVASGDRRYFEEACRSAKSLRKSTPHVKIVLASDEASHEYPEFDEVVLSEGGSSTTGFGIKARAIRDFPHGKFVYLDGDTYVIEDLTPLFELLDRFDFVAAHALSRFTTRLDDVPDSFPEVNTGVLGVRRTAASEAILRAWPDEYEAMRAGGARMPTQDQPALRRLLWRGDARLAVLTPEWNCMFDIGTSVTGLVKVLHGRSPNYERVAQKINRGRPHRLTGLPRSRWFKGEGGGFGWIRRNGRLAVLKFRQQAYARGVRLFGRPPKM